MAEADDTDVDSGGTGVTHREGAGPRKSAPKSDDGPRFERGMPIGRYVIIDVLGAGGMGVVYSAFDPELDRKVAIKVLQARPGGSESGGQSWLVREAQAMARLAHPNVVAVYDVGAINADQVFVAMELVEGVTLRSWLKDRPRGWRDVVPVMRAAGAGLAAAHAAGLIHRDFKPDNVLVGNDGRARVMDFGLARATGSEDPIAPADLPIEHKSSLSDRLTVTGAVLGTPAYMAPEIYAGQRADAAADQFAFGVALYEALYRARPFDRQALVEKRAAMPQPPASAKIPSWLERVVLRAIALDPAQRYPSMDALLVELAADPTAKRRAFAIGGAAVVVAGAAVAGAFVLGGGATQEVVAPSVCADSATKLEGVWDAKARAGIEAAFGKLGKPYAADALAGTVKTLDAYATAWTAMHTETCEATRVYGSQSEDVMTLRMACLGDRRSELAALVQLFGSADDKLVLGSVTAAQKLSTLADCANVPALLAPDPLPKDPAIREAVLAAHGKLAEARALYKTQKLPDTLALLEKLAPEVDKLGHKPTQAELLLLTGQTRWVLQGAAKGEPALLEAVHSAEAGKADAIKVEAWLQLTNLANEAGKFDVARERLQNASSALARLGSNDQWKVRVLDAEALLESRTGNYDKSIKLAADARTLARTKTDGNAYAYALLVQASLLTSAGHAQEAIDVFREVYKLQDALGHNRIDVAITLQTMGSAELAVGKVDEAIAHLQDSLAISEKIYGANNPDIARLLTAIAAGKSAKGDLAGALADNQRALALAEKAGKNTEVYAFVAGQVASSLLQLGRAKEALPYLEAAIEVQTAKLGATSVQTLALVLTKCDVLHDTGAMQQALATCQRALTTAEKALGPTNPMLFLFYAHTANTLVDSKKPREAIPLFERARKLGAADPSDLHYVEMLEARARWTTGDRKGAIALAKRARAGYAALGDAKKELVKDADDWLAKHR